MGKSSLSWVLRGGVGCSIVAALLSRVLSKKSQKAIAVIDAVPFLYSTLPSYLSVASSSHCLLQLLPYQDHLTEKMLKNFFSSSPEGVAYIPIRQNDETPINFVQLFPLVQKILPWFNYVVLDTSSFPNDQYLSWIEKSGKSFFISSLETSSLAAIKHWEAVYFRINLI